MGTLLKPARIRIRAWTVPARDCREGVAARPTLSRVLSASGGTRRRPDETNMTGGRREQSPLPDQAYLLRHQVAD